MKIRILQRDIDKAIAEKPVPGFSLLESGTS